MLLARITVCDYFRLYERLAGLSGEAARAAGQLERLYGLTVASPADDVTRRVDHPDVHFDQASARLAAEIIKAGLRSAYRRREEFVGSGAFRDMESRIALAVLGSNWRQQLRELESMATACGFTQRATDHLPEYQAQAAKLYRALRDRVTEDTLGYLFHADPAG